MGHLLKSINPSAAGIAPSDMPPGDLGPVWSRPTQAMTHVDFPCPSAVVGALVDVGLLDGTDRSNGPRIAVALQRLVDWALKDELVARMAAEDGQQSSSWGQGPRR
jgi:hypothetical protein